MEEHGRDLRSEVEKFVTNKFVTNNVEQSQDEYPLISVACKAVLVAGGRNAGGN